MGGVKKLRGMGNGTKSEKSGPSKRYLFKYQACVIYDQMSRNRS